MNKRLKTVSKGIYILSVLSLFLPAFIPDCSGKKEQKNEVDTVAVQETLPVISDSVFFSSDSTLKDSTVSKEERSILYPDGQNLSFFGYLVWFLSDGLIAIFTLLTIWSGILRWKDKRDLEIALQLSGALTCLLLFTVNKYDSIVWGFWFTFGLTVTNTLVNWKVWFSRSES